MVDTLEAQISELSASLLTWVSLVKTVVQCCPKTIPFQDRRT